VRDEVVLRTKVSIKATVAPSGVEVCGDFDSQRKVPLSNPRLKVRPCPRLQANTSRCFHKFSLTPLSSLIVKPLCVDETREGKKMGEWFD
jgi:hypothetical protein